MAVPEQRELFLQGAGWWRPCGPPTSSRRGASPACWRAARRRTGRRPAEAVAARRAWRRRPSQNPSLGKTRRGGPGRRKGRQTSDRRCRNDRTAADGCCRSALKSMNQATAFSGGIAANRATSSGDPPKPARFKRWRARSGVQSDAPIGDRSSSQASVMASSSQGFPFLARLSPSRQRRAPKQRGKMFTPSRSPSRSLRRRRCRATRRHALPRAPEVRR